MASLSPAELAEKLEKSEAGRKKLRQAISLMQEKLDATEKVLKVNENLRQECEQERQRAEDEKKKAEEEKRLRSLLEKDSVAVKDQLAKVLQRLEALESKQKSDKKEVERVRNEVKLSVQGVGATAEAMNALQSSFQTLEHELLHKVDTAFEKANIASQTTKSFRQSLQSLENNAMKKVNTALEEARNASQIVQTLQQSFSVLENKAVRRGNDKLTSAETQHISKKIVSDITQLFRKEKRSHRRIQHQLAALRTLLKPGRSCTSPKKKELLKLTENEKQRQSNKKEKAMASKKRKLMAEDGPSEWVVNKRGKFQDRTEQGMNSGCTRSLSHGQTENNVPHSVCVGITQSENRAGLCQSNRTHIQLQDLHHETIRERQECGFEEFRIDTHVNMHVGRERQRNPIEDCGREEVRNCPSNLPIVSQTVRQENSKRKNEYAATVNKDRLKKDEGLGDDELEDSWWPGDINPLSPTLPEIHSPSRGEVDMYLESVSGEASHVLAHPLVGANIITKRAEGCADTEIPSAERDHHFPRIEVNPEPIIETHVELTGINVMQKGSSGMDLETEAEAQNAKIQAGSSLRAKLNPKSDCKVNLTNTISNGCGDDISELAVVPVDPEKEIIQSQQEPDVIDSFDSMKTCVHSENQMVNSDASNEVAPSQDGRPEVKLGSEAHTSLDKQNGCANGTLDAEKEIIESQQHLDVTVSFNSSVYVENQMLESNASKEATPLSDHAPEMNFESGTCFTQDEQNRGYPFVSHNISHRNYDTLAPPPQILKPIPLHKPLSLPDTAPREQLGSGLHTSLDKKSRENQLYNSAFETVDKTTVEEIKNFLDDLLPMPPQHDVCALIHPYDTQKLDSVPEANNEIISLAEDENYNNNVGVIVQCSSSPEKEICRALEVSSEQQRSDVIEHNLILQTEGTSAALLKQCKGSATVASSLHAADSFHKKVHNLCLIQAFDFEQVEVKTKVIAACINAIQFNGYFSSSHTCREVMNPGKKLHLITDSAEIPISYVACSLISIVVDHVKVEMKGKDQDPEVNLIDSFVKVFVVLVRTVFRDIANSVFDSVFAQLGSFLNEGKIMVLSFEELESYNQDEVRVPMIGNDIHHLSSLYSEATLDDVCAGSKVLAGLCQVLSCVNHLQNVVYELLGCCDKDTTWLLTVFSSFASICGHTAFVMEADDLLGRVICSIIIELVVSGEQGSVESKETSKSSLIVRSKGLMILIEAIDARGRSSIDDVLLEAVAAIQYGLGSFESLVSGSNLDPTENILNVEDHSTYRQILPSIEGKQSSLCEANSSSNLFKTKEFPTVYEITNLHRLIKWQKKYTEAVAALELISGFMGWEWTYNHLITKWLWRIMASGTVQVQIACVMHVVSMLARIGVTCGKGLLPGMEELRTWMLHILNSVPMLNSGESATYFSFIEDG